MKKILILGSKPGAKIHDAEYCFGANSAIGYYKDELHNFKGEKISVVAASEVTNSARNNLEKIQWNSNRKDLILNSPSNHIILVGYEYFPEVYDSFLEFLMVSNSKLTYSQVFEKLKSITRLKVPVLTKDHVFPLGFSSIKNLYKFYIDSTRRKNSLISGLFRPSTGIIALILAIDQFGLNAEYFLEGVGLSNRNVYPDGNNNTWTPLKKIVASHIFVDRLVLKSLLSMGFKIHIPNNVLLEL